MVDVAIGDNDIVLIMKGVNRPARQARSFFGSARVNLQMSAEETDMKRAIVIGGSVGGLLAARVLADHCQEVTIVDRDRFPAVGEQRHGVPQGRHTHGLLAGGRRALDELLPGISGALVAAGALDRDIIFRSRWFLEGGWLARR